MKGIITVRYKKETGFNPYRFNLFGKKIGYTTAYTKWLEKQCTIRIVGCSLPDINKDEIIEDAYWLNLQNLSGREDFEEVFKLGIEVGVNELCEKLNE